jgi:hypothetical protein
MLRQFAIGLLFQKSTVIGINPATLDQQIGQRLRLIPRPGTAGRRELLQVNQLIFKRQNGKQQVLFDRHFRQEPSTTVGRNRCQWSPIM